MVTSRSVCVMVYEAVSFLMCLPFEILYYRVAIYIVELQNFSMVTGTKYNIEACN